VGEVFLTDEEQLVKSLSGGYFSIEQGDLGEYYFDTVRPDPVEGLSDM